MTATVNAGGAVMELRVLGPLEVRNGSRPVDVGGTRQRRLLAALLVDAPRVATT